MAFVQIIEVRTDDPEALVAAHEAWLAATEGQRTTIGEMMCEDRDRPGTYLMVVEFPSVEAAAINNDLPATAEIAASLASLALEPPTFRNLDVIRHD